MRQNGLLMEVKGKKAVVLGKDGRFYTTAVQAGWEIGQEITWDPNLRRKSYRVPIWQKTLAAGAAACLILGGGLWYAVQHSTLTTAYAYVSVDINPSILYTLNHQEKVIDAKGLNADGKTLLTHLHPKGEGLQKVLNETVKTAVLNHMLPKRDTILVTAAPIHSNEDVSTLMSMARSDMEQAVTMNPQAVKQDPGVYSLPVSAAVSQAAQKLKVSPGKLIAYLAAHQAGQNVRMQQLHGQVLKDILTNAQLPNVLSTIQADNVHQIEDWVSKAMSVKDQPAVQKSSNNNSTKNNGQNVVSSSTPPSPAKVPSHSSQSHVPTTQSSQRGSNGKGHTPKGNGNGNGKHLAKGHNGGNNGKHYGQTKHSQSGSSVKNSVNGVFSMGRRGQGNQIGSTVQNIINKIESMGGQPKVPESSSSDTNRSTSYPSDSSGNQTRPDGTSPAGNQTSSSGDSQSLNTVQNDTFNGSNTSNQSNDQTGNDTVNGSSNSSGNSPSDQTDSGGDN